VDGRIWFQDDRQPGIDQDGSEPRYTVVGVVDDVRFDDLAGEATPMLYMPLEQFWSLESIRVVMRSPSTPQGVVNDLRSIISELDPTTAVSDVGTYESRLGATIARPRFAAYLLMAFAGVALFMAAVGVYGVLSYALSRRVPEIGVRLAFGASEGHVFRLLFSQGMRLTLVGIALGIPAAMGASRFLSSLLFGVDPMDPRLLASVAIILLVVGVVVSYFPARRAARIDPMVALRQD
jgi:ABC-type antimicrobial peptide transport system permease subunit